MGSNNSTRAVVSMIVVLVLIILLSLSSGTQANSSASSPPAMARRGGPIPPPLQLPKSTIPDSEEDRNCPLIKVPDLINACRRAPGLRACAAECIVYHYRGGYCDVLPNGRPGDCFCGNCLAEQQSVSVRGLDDEETITTT